MRSSQNKIFCAAANLFKVHQIPNLDLFRQMPDIYNTFVFIRLCLSPTDTLFWIENCSRDLFTRQGRGYYLVLCATSAELRLAYIFQWKTAKLIGYIKGLVVLLFFYRRDPASGGYFF